MTAGLVCRESGASDSVIVRLELMPYRVNHHKPFTLADLIEYNIARVPKSYDEFPPQSTALRFSEAEWRSGERMDRSGLNLVNGPVREIEVFDIDRSVQ